MARRVRAAAALLLSLAALGARQAQAQPVAYALDPTHSFVHFEVLHFGTSTLQGRFGPLQGQISLDRGERRGRLQVAVDLAKVSTGLPILDARLREADMLDVAGAAQAWFIATQFTLASDGAVQRVRGEFTLRGVSQPLELVAQRYNCYFNPLFRREVCGGDFTAEIRRSDFGITHSLPFVADTVRLRVQVEAIRQDAEAAP